MWPILDSFPVPSLLIRTRMFKYIKLLKLINPFQLAETERLASTSELNASATRSRLVELENLHQNTEEENAKLRRDKALLVDHTSGLQKQVSKCPG